jgi:hypothetical protein
MKTRLDQEMERIDAQMHEDGLLPAETDEQRQAPVPMLEPEPRRGGEL